MPPHSSRRVTLIAMLGAALLLAGLLSTPAQAQVPSGLRERIVRLVRYLTEAASGIGHPVVRAERQARDGGANPAVPEADELRADLAAAQARLAALQAGHDAAGGTADLSRFYQDINRVTDRILDNRFATEQQRADAQQARHQASLEVLLGQIAADAAGARTAADHGATAGIPA